MSINQELKNIILKNYANNKLAQFYIIEPNLNNNQKCTLWIHDVLAELCQKNELKNHQDILFLDTDEKSYSKHQIESIYEFCHFKSNSLNRKFIVIENSDALSEIHFNKLLKLLEEPPIELTCFLIHSSKKKLLDTVSSRSITLRPVFEKENNKLESLVGTLDLEFNDFCTWLKESEISQLELYEYVITLINKNIKEFTHCDEILKSLQKVEDDMLYHNSTQSIIFKLYTTLKSLGNLKI